MAVPEPPPSHNFDARHPPPLWERIIAGIGLLLVVALLAYLLAEAIAGDESPPNVVIEITGIHASGDDFLVTFEARNDGGETAAGVVISGTLWRGSRVIESVETTMDYIPAESSRHGGLFFRHDPRKADFRLAPSGYILP